MAPKRKPPTKRRKSGPRTSGEEPAAQDAGKREEVEETSKLLNRMKTIFDSVQKGYTHVGKNIEKLWELKQSDKEEVFFNHFWYLLQHVCLVAAREPPTERIIQFCCKFAIRADLEREEFADAEVSQTGPFAIALFRRCLKYHNANNKAVRFRLCQIVNIILASLGGDAEIDEELYNLIYNCMLERLKDKVPGVRVQAVNTLNRLQDPTDPECPVMKGYLTIMKTDGVAEVRRAAVKAIAVSSKSLMPIIERTRDTNPGVRRAAYEVLIDKISIRAMKISYRMKLLESGLRDRNPNVKEACISLIKKWVLYYENDIVKLLKALDVEGKVELCEEVVSEILHHVHIDTAVECLVKRQQNKVIPTEELSCENVFYWHCLVAHCASQHPDIYDKIMPTLSDFSKYLKEYVITASSISSEDYDAHYQASYVVKVLIKIAKLGDMSDEAGRKALILVTKYIMIEAEITVQSIERLVELYCVAEDDEQARIKTVASVINDVRNPLEGATQFDLNSIESCEKNDPVTMIRCLTMVSGLIQNVKCDVAFDPTLSVLLENVVMSGVVSQNEIVRHLSIKALGLSCILSKTLARKYLVFFLQVVLVDNYAEILETSLKVIFDLFLVFGIDTFEEDEEKKEEDKEENGDLAEEDEEDISVSLTERMDATSLETSQDKEKQASTEQETFANKIIERFKEFLDDEILRGVAAEGIAKLMYNGRLVDPQLFSRLLILWYNPTTEDDPLRHCLGMFFSTFGADKPESLEVVEQAFFPTLETICDAPHTSPLQEINPANVAELMLSLLRGFHHEQIAIKMCNEILIRPSSSYGRCLVKALQQCNVLTWQQSNVKLVLSLTQQILDEVELASTKKSLNSFIVRLNSLITKPLEDKEDKENSSPPPPQNSQTSSVKSTESAGKTAKRKALFATPSQPLDLLDNIT